MNKLKHTSKVIFFDILGVICIIASILLGWLPGPGGIPLFLVGLGFISMHHEWAEKYIDLFKKYADHVGDLFFVEKPFIQALYDVLSIFLLGASAWLLVHRPSVILTAAGVSFGFLSILIFLRNRHRFNRIKKKLKK